MAKFYGVVGYAETKETSPGIYEEVFVERTYSGDLNRNTRRLESSGGVNDDVTIANEVSIMVDPYAYDNFHSIRYVEYRGTCWKVTNITDQFPRLLLTLGGVYNGKKA